MYMIILLHLVTAVLILGEGIRNIIKIDKGIKDHSSFYWDNIRMRLLVFSLWMFYFTFQGFEWYRLTAYFFFTGWFLFDSFMGIYLRGDVRYLGTKSRMDRAQKGTGHWTEQITRLSVIWIIKAILMILSILFIHELI